MTLFSWKTLTGRFSFLELFDSGGRVVELFSRVPQRQHPAHAGFRKWYHKCHRKWLWKNTARPSIVEVPGKQRIPVSGRISLEAVSGISDLGALVTVCCRSAQNLITEKAVTNGTAIRKQGSASQSRRLSLHRRTDA